jgi:superfamily II DNA or RNA helicase
MMAHAPPLLRPYQEQALAAIAAEFDAGRRSTLLVLPTGTGKTVVFAEAARRICDAGHRTLVLAHRNELLEQAVSKLEAIGVWAQLERGTSRAGGADVVVASVQTMHAKRLQRFARDAFGLVVVDEAHHAMAGTYRAVLEHFASAHVLGVTATPDRSDGEALGKLFESVAYRYELRAAIRDQWLSPIRARRIEVDGLDVSKVHTRAGDLAANELAEIMLAEQVLHGIAAPLVERAGDRRTICFTVDVATAHALADVVNRYKPDSARAVDGSASDLERRTVLHEFRLGKFQFLVNCALFTEGFDEPTISCVAMCRPTKSRALFTQCIGRGTRLAPGKADCLVLDFAGNAGRHRLVGPADALAGHELTDAQRDAINKMLAAEQRELDGVLAAADDEVAKQRDRVKLVAVAHYRETEIDLFVGDFYRKPPPGGWTGDPATPAQLVAIESAGLSRPPEGLTKAEASAILDGIYARQRAGLATVKQRRLLHRSTRNCIDTSSMTFSRATELIIKGKQRGFRPATYSFEPEYGRRRA